MPFHKRTVVPHRLCRLTKEQFRCAAGHTDLGEVDCCSSLTSYSYSWTSLDDVSCTALKNLLCQLSDLSRHACSVFLDIQNEASLVVYRSTALQQRLDTLQDSVRKLDHKNITIPVSSLDEESKWSVHYTAPWHQQENVFLPGSRPPCVEDLHLQAKVNLKTVLRECDKLRKDGFRSSQYYSQGPAFSSPVLSHGPLDQDEVEKKKKSSESSAEEEKLVYSMGPQTPLLDNFCDSQSSWSKSLPLPTPEEKMRQQAQTVATDIIPINITGESFDRQASFRRTLSNTDTVIRRSKKVKRRKTITGVPDNVQRELAKGQNDIRTHSMYMPGQYSTLGHTGTVNSTPKHSDTCNSGCQTEESKIVPPSMRRIRAQKGCGIAAQMANLSLSSSGSISNISDSNGAICSPQRNGSDQGFHSLPRQGARISLQQPEPKYTSSPYRMVNGCTSSMSYQVNMQHVSPSQQMLVDSRTNALIFPKCADFQGFQNGQHNAISGYKVSSHSSSVPATPNGALLNFTEISSIHSAQSIDTVETLQSVPSCPSNHPFNSAGTSVSAGSSRCQSPASLNTANHTETDSQCSTLNGNCNSPSGIRRDSDFSEDSMQSCSTLTIDQWTYENAPKGQQTSSCSSPVSHVYNSLERSPTKTDSSSLFSVDNEGYYTSMHLDSGLKSHSHGCINQAINARHNLYECREHHSQGDRASLHSNQSLTRSISLRKAKKPPLPPKRTDSLRRKPKRKPHQSETVLNEKLISSLQESLKSNSASLSGKMSCNGFDDPWVLRPRSQSTVSAASSGMSAPAAMCPVTPTHSEGSSQHSECAESWNFYMDFPHSRSEQSPPSPKERSVNTGAKAGGFNMSDHKGFPSAYSSKTRLKLNLATSPDKVHHVTSPSSGYSSQSITPTAGTPVTSLLRAKSPAGRPKPKVPERKSSLRSSVSSSTTSLSSNTSDSVKNLPTPPPLPTTLPGLTILHFAQSVSTSPTTKISPNTAASSLLTEKIYPPQSPKTKEYKASFSGSPCFPSPLSEITDSLLLRENTAGPPPSPPPLPPPPPLPLTLPCCVHTPPPPPPLPEIGLHAETILKTTNSLVSMESMEEIKEPNSSQPGEPFKPQRPLITAQALKLVQLRPIKLMSLENIFTDIITTVCSPEDNEQEPHRSDIPVEIDSVENINAADSDGPIENGMDTSESPQEDFIHSILYSQSSSDLIEPVSYIQSYENVQELSLDSEHVSSPPAFNLQQSTVAPVVSQSTPKKQKPPISPKKPGLSLIMPPILHQPILKNLEPLEVTGPEEPSEPETLNNSTSLGDSVNLQEMSLQVDVEVESDSGNSTPVGPRRVSFSSEFSSDSMNDPHFTAYILNEHDLGLSDHELGLSDKDLGLSDDKGISDDGSSSSSGSISFKDDDNEENGAAFDSSTDISSPTSSTNEELEEMVTPARPRTTEDLFAAIHRSKRKVLGRGDSEEERIRCVLPSPPVTPTGACPGLSSLPRQTSFIQRSLRRSPTSNDSFKALLLRKGSRSESGFRMSAAEMLKYTDPRLQRPTMEVPQPDSPQPEAPCTSPGRSRRASEEWARAEGALPRLSASLTSSKYGRSSTPPSAASSRYNSRSRIPSGPMTVICEKEGELSESVDCCLSAEIPFPISLTSSGTVCAQGST